MFGVQVEGNWMNEFDDRPEKFKSWDDAAEFCGTLFDSGNDGDFRVKDLDTGGLTRIRGYQMVKQECPACEKEVRSWQMGMTHDCHGIAYRKVCQKCYDKLMCGRGFDGERYSELDECLDEDY